MSLLDEILAPGGLVVLLQPIFRIGPWGIDGLHGFEALTRGAAPGNASRADVLFDYVRRKHAEPPVDRACVHTIFETIAALHAFPSLSFNVHAATLGRDSEFAGYIVEEAAHVGIDPRHLTVEIVEHSSHWDGTAFQASLDALRDAGVQVALDDVGFGHSNLHMILECRPHYLKLDRYFVRRAAHSAPRRAVLRGMAQLAADLGAEIVAEGVEQLEDLDAVITSGIRLAQGYLLGPPVPAAGQMSLASLQPPVEALSLNC
ncbi:MAG: EAL domain-containing protein [Gemmatimonadales bacterium]